MPIRPDLPPEPEFGAPLDPAHPSPETLRLLALRRSTPVAVLTEPEPNTDRRMERISRVSSAVYEWLTA